jgi:quinol-cytochrome oxidoreductase complex cytochrome b subunit
MSLLNNYIFFVFFIKITFVILAIINLYLKKEIQHEEKEKNKSDKIKKQEKTQQNIEYWKIHIELLFKFLMSILLIYIFNPRQNRIHLINYEAKLLFFLFGIILVFTANWEQIFNESKIFINIQSVLDEK